MLKKDFRSEPIKRLVVMGESNAYGMSASDPLNEWVQILALLIRRFQNEPIRVFNNSIPANVISSNSPGYDPNNVFDTDASVTERFYGTAPSALERYREDMINYKPDLAMYAYGLNDSRCGYKLNDFIEDYEKIILDTKNHLPDALLVIVGPYWSLQYDSEAWGKKKKEIDFGKFSLAGDELVLKYNYEISKLAKKYDAVFVDIYSVLEKKGWLLSDDGCHFHDLGHWIIGQTVFAEVACNCSFLSKKSIKALRELELSVFNTGGTSALPHVISSWRVMRKWNK